MKHIKHLVIATLASGSLGLASAHAEVPRGMGEAALSSWERAVSLEPCMNGDVSASGVYPSQIAEDKSFATLGTLADRPSQ